MSVLKADPEQVVIPPTPIETDMTLEEFLESDLEGYEYVKGELIPMPPTSGEHGDISMNLVLPLGTYVRANQLGRVYTSDTGFKIDDRFLIPDIAFVSIERLPDDRRKAFSIPPDLAVEIVSPTDVLFRVFEKALTYLSGGTQLVWVIEPVAKTVTVYRSETDIKVLTREETLTGEDIIEGFSCEISQLFE
ncbi:MAG: Uma2 family endonuclease [Candidatus Poribacteria bacterium]|nr:Uma2 family endonuclease [Candidatus Poribacteria bacterium]